MAAACEAQVQCVVNNWKKKKGVGCVVHVSAYGAAALAGKILKCSEAFSNKEPLMIINAARTIIHDGTLEAWEAAWARCEMPLWCTGMRHAFHLSKLWTMKCVLHQPFDMSDTRVVLPVWGVLITTAPYLALLAETESVDKCVGRYYASARMLAVNAHSGLAGVYGPFHTAFNDAAIFKGSSPRLKVLMQNLAEKTAPSRLRLCLEADMTSLIPHALIATIVVFTISLFAIYNLPSYHFALLVRNRQKQ